MVEKVSVIAMVGQQRAIDVMQHYELITAEDYENLPEDPEQQFVEVERICRRNMTQMIMDNPTDDFDTIVRMQYMTTVAAAAQELGIVGLDYPHSAEYPSNEIDTFMLQASGVVTRIRLRSSRKNKALSVQLGVRTRAKIELQINKLRGIIEEAEISESKRKALLEKLNELSTELNKARLSFAKTMAILAYVSLGITIGTSFLADAPQAVATITSLIGKDKELEEDELKRLGPPPEIRSLPAPKLQIAQAAPANSFGNDLEDEVPF